MNSVLVVGALHFLGARLVSRLASLGVQVRAAASYDMALHGDELVWYREEQLRTHHDISVGIGNLSNQSQVEGLLAMTEGATPPSQVVFVPPGVDGDAEEMEGKVLNAVMSQSLVEFTILLENVRKLAPCTRVVLISRSDRPQTIGPSSSSSSSSSSIFLAWMETFELLLSTYHNAQHVPVGLLRLGGGVHGPWGRQALHMHKRVLSRPGGPGDPDCRWWFVRDVVAGIEEVVREPGKCVVKELDPCFSRKKLSKNGDPSSLENQLPGGSVKEKWLGSLEASRRWASSYLSGEKPSARVILTSYFTSSPDPQRPLHSTTSSQFQYMADFYRSLKALGLRAVVFHDGLDTGFQHRLTSHHPRLSFVEVPSLKDRSTNDARFYTYYDYLLRHPEIESVLLTDISDVSFQRNPFELMSLLGDWLYVGTDIDIFPDMRSMPWIRERLSGCFGNHSMAPGGELSRLMELDTVYNAGTVGGSRHVMLDVLTAMVTYLDSCPTELNCNMPCLNYAVHKHFFQRVFTGFPLHSRFLRHQHSPKGVYLVHK